MRRTEFATGEAPRNRHSNKRYRETRRGRAITLIVQARSRARKAGIAFDIDRNDIIARFIVGKCERTGLRLEFSTDGDARVHPRAPSLDRIDPRKGYTRGNVLVVCMQYNVAKNQWTEEPLVEFCRAMLARQKKKAKRGRPAAFDPRHSGRRM